VEGQVVPIDRRPAPRRDRASSPGTVTAVCARPMCRREFSQRLDRGRPRNYCSADCRRIVDNERRRTRSRLEHYQQNVDRLRADAAAYIGGERAAHHPDVTLNGPMGQALEAALIRAEGVIAGAGPKNRLAGELALLVDAVRNHLDPGIAR
jgi:hypothetical protein